MARAAQTYVNTMVFAIIAGMVSIALLLALVMAESLSEYMIVIVTIELGLIAIIVHALYKVVAYEGTMRKAINNAGKNSFAADNCPDYYTLKFSTDGIDQTTCLNAFNGTNPDGKKFIMYYVPSDTYERTGEGRAVRFPGNPPDGAIKIKALETMTTSDACKAVQGLPAESDSSKTAPNNHSIPWTDLRPKCETVSH